MEIIRRNSVVHYDQIDNNLQLQNDTYHQIVNMLIKIVKTLRASRY